MRILYLTFGPLNEQSSHLLKLHHALPFLETKHEIIILNMSQENDSISSTVFKTVDFRNFHCLMNGWEIKNLSETLQYVFDTVQQEEIELVVLQMEVWELMRELPQVLYGTAAFITVVHAMPFLGSPNHPTTDFEKDVLRHAKYIKTDFRAAYNIKHYSEAALVFEKGEFITTNKSVDWFIHHYFPNTHTQLVSESPQRIFHEPPTEKEFDIAYMARIEEGKGLEYFKDILPLLSKRLMRKVRLIILGRTDDTVSHDYLNELLKSSENSEVYEVVHTGWANFAEKKHYLGLSRVFVYPSTYDNDPTVIYEAQAFGLPCVMWDLPFSRLNFHGIKSILLANHLDINGMVDQILYAMENGNELSQSCKEYTRAGTSEEKLAEIFDGVYSKAIAHRL